MRLPTCMLAFLLTALPALAQSIAPATAPSSSSRPSQPQLSSYFLIPIVGRLGREVPLSAFAEALAAADEAGALYVLLYVDSPGAEIEDAERFLHLLISPPRRVLLAIVRRADGAAAALPFACRWVFVSAAGGSSLLASRPEDAKPEELVQLRRLLELACAAGERNMAVASAMGDPDFAVYGDGSGEVAMVPRGPDWRLLKPSGSVLAITDENALASGYADGLYRNLDDLALRLGISRGWRSAGDHGQVLMQAAATDYQRQLRRQLYYRQHRTEIEQLQSTSRRLRGELEALATAPSSARRTAAEAELAQTLDKLRLHEEKMK
jgi:hypothetical protein